MILSSSRTVPLVVAAALFMEHLDSTIIATALPAMAADLRVSPITLNLAITAYQVSVAVFIPASGWFADRFGARRVFVSAIGVFLIGSIVCGLSPSMAMLIVGRLLQGLGGAMMVPVGRLVMLRSVPKAELISAMAWLTVPALIGPVMGPPLGGLISTYASWRWIFWINVPIGLAGIVIAFLLLPSIREEDTPRFDHFGFLACALGLSASVFALETFGREVVAWPVTAIAALVGISALVIYARHARFIAKPLVDLKLMRIETFRSTILGGSVFRIGVGALPFLLPLQLQLGFGRSALESGLTTFVTALGALTMKFAAARIIQHFGFRSVLVSNCLIAAVMIVAIAAVGPGTPMLLLMAVLLAGGFFRSLEFTAINAIGYSDIAAAEMSRATSFSSMAQQLSLSGGVAFSALILHGLSRFDGSGPTPTMGQFSIALAVVGSVSALAALMFARLPADAGAAMLPAAKTAADTSPDDPV